MAFVDWKPEFSVGVTEIDSQHKRLLDVINQLHAAMKMGGRPAVLEEVVNELVGYTRYHFAYEERLLETAGYRELEEHRRKHRAMVAQVEAFREQASVGQATMPLKLMSFLKDWLSRHIMETDQRYASHVAGVKV
jgi:hemerythrin